MTFTMTRKRLANERKIVEIHASEYTLSELQESSSKLWWDMTILESNIIVRIEYESGYPFRSPYLIFQTPMDHPNIHPSGLTSNLLNEPWSPSYTIQTLYERIQYLLAHPIPEFRMNSTNPNA
jgi:ubiquitin-protein ligase